MNSLDTAYKTIQRICYHEKLPQGDQISSALEALQEAYGHLSFQNSSGFISAIEASSIENKMKIERLFASIVRLETKPVNSFLDTLAIKKQTIELYRTKESRRTFFHHHADYLLDERLTIYLPTLLNKAESAEEASLLLKSASSVANYLSEEVIDHLKSFSQKNIDISPELKTLIDQSPFFFHGTVIEILETLSNFQEPKSVASAATTILTPLMSADTATDVLIALNLLKTGNRKSVAVALEGLSFYSEQLRNVIASLEKIPPQKRQNVAVNTYSFLQRWMSEEVVDALILTLAKTNRRERAALVVQLNTFTSEINLAYVDGKIDANCSNILLTAILKADENDRNNILKDGTDFLCTNQNQNKVQVLSILALSFPDLYNEDSLQQLDLLLLQYDYGNLYDALKYIAPQKLPRALAYLEERQEMIEYCYDYAIIGRLFDHNSIRKASEEFLIARIHEEVNARYTNNELCFQLQQCLQEGVITQDKTPKLLECAVDALCTHFPHVNGPIKTYKFLRDRPVSLDLVLGPEPIGTKQFAWKIPTLRAKAVPEKFQVRDLHPFPEVNSRTIKGLFRSVRKDDEEPDFDKLQTNLSSSLVQSYTGMSRSNPDMEIEKAYYQTFVILDAILNETNEEKKRTMLLNFSRCIDECDSAKKEAIGIFYDSLKTTPLNRSMGCQVVEKFVHTCIQEKMEWRFRESTFLKDNGGNLRHAPNETFYFKNLLHREVGYIFKPHFDPHTSILPDKILTHSDDAIAKSYFSGLAIRGVANHICNRFKDLRVQIPFVQLRTLFPTIKDDYMWTKGNKKALKLNDDGLPIEMTFNGAMTLLQHFAIIEENKKRKIDVGPEPRKRAKLSSKKVMNEQKNN